MPYAVTAIGTAIAPVLQELRFIIPVIVTMGSQTRADHKTRPQVHAPSTPCNRDDKEPSIISRAPANHANHTNHTPDVMHIDDHR
ncbi:hypothetical protein VTN49DRAFT_1501 [Thermomyces lanuginosus]|uniref:uncharacterized protein n=1 Tax=Thermomyces lanuginosus TaxID=5541 RepID=UPI0037432112